MGFNTLYLRNSGYLSRGLTETLRKVEHLTAYLESRISYTTMHHSGRDIF